MHRAVRRRPCRIPPPCFGHRDDSGHHCSFRGRRRNAAHTDYQPFTANAPTGFHELSRAVDGAARGRQSPSRIREDVHRNRVSGTRHIDRASAPARARRTAHMDGACPDKAGKPGRQPGDSARNRSRQISRKGQHGGDAGRAAEPPHRVRGNGHRPDLQSALPGEPRPARAAGDLIYNGRRLHQGGCDGPRPQVLQRRRCLPRLRDGMDARTTGIPVPGHWPRRRASVSGACQSAHLSQSRITASGGSPAAQSPRPGRPVGIRNFGRPSDTRRGRLRGAQSRAGA
jgi:hypothetical protein